MNLAALTNLTEDKLDCECQGGTWKQSSATYGSCDPGPLTTGLYWDRVQRRCKSPFETDRPSEPPMKWMCMPGYHDHPLRGRGGPDCEPDVPAWVAPAVVITGFLVLYWIVSR